MYALVLNGSIVAVRNPERVEAKLLDGAPLSPPDGIWTQQLAAACGFVVVVEPPRPTITATQTFDPDTFEMIGGAPTRVYHVRNKTQAELDADVAAAAAQQERDQAKAAITQLDAFIQNGTNNTAAQTRDQVVLHARILKRLIRDAFQG